MKVLLEQVTRGNVRAICALAVGPGQEGRVAPNAVSLAEALVEPAAWPRAITADGRLAGFVQLYDPSLPGVEEPDPGLPPGALLLWRLMVAQGHQGRGIGRAALGLVAAHGRARGFRRLAVTYVPGAGGPAGFYRRLGFEPTGRVVDGEAEALLDLGLDGGGRAGS